jgi:aspartate/methionine/tyrosine aminotransferase
MDWAGTISRRASVINGSGIRRVFDMGARLKDPINLSIGQPDFPVPAPIKRAAIDAIEHDRNGYTPTAGIPELRARIAEHVRRDLGWDVRRPGEAGRDLAPPVPAASATGASDTGLLVTSGTSGGLVLACMATLNPGDEIIIPDPWFVLYPHLADICQAEAVACDTYPDFALTAERVAPLLTERTKIVLTCSPGNPSGVVASTRAQRELLALCQSRGIVLVSDEIYDEFAFSEARTEPMAAPPTAPSAHADARCPSPARAPGAAANTLVIRGFGKSYGVTGWRLGYAVGPTPLIAEMTKLQQYLYVCAPTPLQHGAAAAFDVSLEPMIAEYQRRRDMVIERLSRVTDVAVPGGAFYAFPKVPAHLGMTGTEFFQKCYDRNVLIVPGKAFSSRDTHFRLSFATPLHTLERGVEILESLLRGT